MKKLILLTFVFVISIAASLLRTEEGAHGFTSGAPAGNSASPFDNGGQSCARSGCHSGGFTIQQGLISTNIPATGYVPGQTYQITATVTFPGRTKFGFQFSPQTATGATAGTLVGNSTVQLQSAGRFVTHVSSSTPGPDGFRTWTVNWIAPAAGTGAVTFYGAFNAANSNNSGTGDVIYHSSTTVQEASLEILVEGEPEICPGETVTLSSNFANGNTWQLNGVAIPGANQASITVAEPGIYTLLNGSLSAQTTISQIPLPNVPEITAFPASGAFCSGSSVQLNVDAGNFDVLWSNGATSPSINTNQPGSYTVTLSNICGSATSPAFMVSETSEPQTPLINGGLTEISACAGESITLLASVPPTDSVVWFPANFVGNPYTVNEAGNYFASVSNNCGTVNSALIEVSFIAPPAVPIISVNGNVLAATGTNASFFEWYLNGVLIPFAFLDTYEAVESGTYTVMAYDAFGLCTNGPSEPVQINVVSVQLQAELSLTLFPNPASSSVWAELPKPGRWGIRLMQLNGTLIEEKVIVGEAGTQCLWENVSHLPKGVYLIELMHAEGIFRKKLLKS